MRKEFVRTKNALNFLSKFKKLEQRGAGEACLLLVQGEPGLGKTETVQWWAVQSNAVFLRAKSNYKPGWFLRELLGELGVKEADLPGTYERLFTLALSRLTARAADNARIGKPFAVVIDEVEHITGQRKLMETVRDLSDMLELPFVLVSMGAAARDLKRLTQTLSRIGQRADFSRLDEADAATLVAGLCEVAVAPEMVAFLHRAAAGYSREMVDGIAAIERVGKLNPGIPVALEHMAGKELFTDRKSGDPVKVPAGALARAA